MAVRGGITNPREEEHENEDVRAHRACGGEAWSGKSVFNSAIRTTDRKQTTKSCQKVRDVFAGRALL